MPHFPGFPDHKTSLLPALTPAISSPSAVHPPPAIFNLHVIGVPVLKETKQEDVREEEEEGGIERT